MAGIEFAPLVMEPVASAMAYGLQFSTNGGFLLVYDLRDGTLDISLMKVDADCINVIDHGGDNQLGGTDFDKMIVNRIVIPKLEKEFDLEGVIWVKRIESMVLLIVSCFIRLSSKRFCFQLSLKLLWIFWSCVGIAVETMLMLMLTLH